MTGTDMAFESLVDAFRAISETKDLKPALSRFTFEIGETWFSYFQLGAFQPSKVHSLPKAWVEEYIKSKFSEVDPMILRVYRKRRPFLWHVEIDNCEISIRAKASYLTYPNR
jgi:LuxR family transcriptional regulator, activator of conjugal transfer of Ti plasmids